MVSSNHKYKFSHRSGNLYYWTRRLEGGYEEQVSCNVNWFWNKYSGDSSLTPCNGDCNYSGFYEASGVVPPGHKLVIGKTKYENYLAHENI